MQTKCGNIIPLPEIPLYINSDHLNVLLVSLNEKNTKQKNPPQTPHSVSVRASTGDLSIKTESKKRKELQVLHNFIHLNCLQFGKFFFVRLQFFTHRVNHVTHNILRFGIQHH